MIRRLIFCISLLLVAPALSAQTEAYCLLQEGDALRLTERFGDARERYLDALSYYEAEQDAFRMAYIYWALSEASYYTVEYKQGLDEATTALRIAESRLQVDTLSIYCIILQNIGLLHSLLGDSKQQMAYYRRTFDAALKTHGWYSWQMADAYSSLGVAYGYRNNWTKCINYLDTSLYIANILNYREGQAVGLSNISYAYAKNGDFVRAIRTQKKALPLADNEKQRESNLNNLGTLYLDVKDYPNAMDCLQKALFIRGKGDKNQGVHYFNTRLSLIYAQYQQGMLDTALTSLDKLLAELDAMPDPFPVAKKIALNYKAGTYLRSKDYEAALNFINEAEAVRTQDIPVIASTFYVKSKILYAWGRHRPALQAVHKGMAALLPDRESLSLRDTLDWRKLGSIDHGLNLLVKRGAILRAQAKQYDQPGLLAESLASLKMADSLVTGSRLSFVSRVSKTIMMDNAKSLYDGILSTLYELYRLDGNPKYVAQAFHYMEKNKAFSVLENLNEIHARSFHDIPARIAERELELREEIDYYRTELSYTTDSQAREQIDTKLGELEQEQYTLLRKIETVYPRYYQTRLQLTVTDLETARNDLLYSGENMIEYFVSGDQLYAIVANRDSASFAKLDVPHLAEQCNDFYDALSSQSPTGQLSHELYQALLAPLNDKIKGDKLLIIPDGAVNFIPFDPLVVDTDKDGKPHYLLEDFSVRRLLSASTALQLRAMRKPLASGQVLALSPDFGEGESTTREGDTLASLLGAQLELDSLAQSYEGYYLRGEQATEAAIKQAKNHRGVLHLATHAEIDNKLPIASRLILEAGQQEDGYLHAYELYRISLSAELAFLSACNTGYGIIRAGEGVVSLAHAFAYAGCPNLVMSLWPVRDRTAPTLVSAYYRYLKQGSDKAEALRQAKKFYLKFEPLNNHPYYWSGFTYIGDREPLELQPALDSDKHRNVAWGALALLLIVLFTAYRLTRP